MSNNDAAILDPYHSRVSTEWEVVPREDPVLWGDSSGPLVEKNLHFYEEHGFLAVPQLISQEDAAGYLAEVNHLAETVNPREQGVITESGTNIVRSIFRIHRTHDKLKALCKHPKLVDTARQLLGSDVYIHQSRINFKPAFHGKEFFWHSDFETWHIEDGLPRMRTVSVSLSLTENTEFNGPLMLVPGSHKSYVRCVGETPENHYEHSLKKQEYGVPNREALQMLVDRGGIQAPKGKPGSAVFFECNTMHGSVGNLSPYPRTNLFIVFNSVENALLEPFGGLPPRPDYLAEREIIPVDEL